VFRGGGKKDDEAGKGSANSQNIKIEDAENDQARKNAPRGGTGDLRQTAPFGGVRGGNLPGPSNAAEGAAKRCLRVRSD